MHMLFIYRLKKENPERILLGLDTMVMDNNDTQKREGVSPTYKKVKGFQPIHLTLWMSIDAAHNLFSYVVWYFTLFPQLGQMNPENLKVSIKCG